MAHPPYIPYWPNPNLIELDPPPPGTEKGGKVRNLAPPTAKLDISRTTESDIRAAVASDL